MSPEKGGDDCKTVLGLAGPVSGPARESPTGQGRTQDFQQLGKILPLSTFRRYKSRPRASERGAESRNPLLLSDSESLL